MKQTSHYRKLKYLEAGLGIAKHVMGMLWLLWPWK